MCEFNLPVSKAEPQALGKKRRLACSCDVAGQMQTRRVSPVAAARRLHSRAVRFAIELGASAPEVQPLWPNAVRRFVTKQAATSTFVVLAKAIGIDSRITGHVCRVTGAQAMAATGIDVWVIQAFCRWGSAAILGYLRDTHLAPHAGLASQVARRLELTEVRDELYQVVRQGSKGHDEAGLVSAIERVMEHKLEQVTHWAGLAGNFRIELTEAAKRIKVIESAIANPWARTYIINRDKLPGKVHIARTNKVCWCGWYWAGRDLAEPVAAVLPNADLCSKCAAVAPQV